MNDPSTAAIDADERARRFAVDPEQNVVLEASAGTGKTSVLVARYVNLMRRGVDPANVLAITFTRKAAAEMRERILRELRRAADGSVFDQRRWAELRDRLADIQVSTIDAFCLSLLREFPLEADVDPGFDLADETQVPSLVELALDRSLRIFTAGARSDPDFALVLAQLGINRAREGLAHLLERRLVAWDVLDAFLARGPAGLTAGDVCRAARESLQGLLAGIPGGLTAWLADGPLAHPRFQRLARDLRALPAGAEDDASTRALMDRVAAHFLRADGTPRQSDRSLAPYRAQDYPSAAAARRHRAAVVALSAPVAEALHRFARDLNVVLARGVRKMFAIAQKQYEAALDERAVIDFSGVLERAVLLLRRMDEFSQSRFQLENRYQHVLVDEFQDTSRKQWELVSLLIKAWGEGAGTGGDTSIFVVGDRKQSIYRFRDADVSVLPRAADYIEGLRPGRGARRSITRSLRAVPPLLAFVNDLFEQIGAGAARDDAFRYGERDRFPVAPQPPHEVPVLGIAVAETPEACAAIVAGEIARILREDDVRDRQSGIARRARPGDVAILFRSRASHREFEAALEAHGIPTYVYKGLGFFDADEIKDALALIRFLADPSSDLRTAAFLRSRFIRLSDTASAALAPSLARALVDVAAPAAIDALAHDDRAALDRARTAVRRWLPLVDRIPPAELLERILVESAYAYELRGPRRQQGWENLKKMRGLIRRIQNRGYATFARIAEDLAALTAGDESNAVLEAIEAVNLMTVHAAKGLEFPIVFVVNVAKGATGPPRPVRLADDSVSIGPFVSEDDQEERAREQEETKRLLYVALTRARDRLYLASLLKNGAMAPGPGSLGEVLPASLQELFAAAAGAEQTLPWVPAPDRAHAFRVCRVAAIESCAPAGTPAIPSTAESNFRIVEDPPDVEAMSVTQWLAGSAEPAIPTASDSASLIGTLVHRLFQFEARRAEAGGLGTVDWLVRPDERASVDDVEDAIARATAIYGTLRARSDVCALLASGDCLHEVPFSLRLERTPPVILRGTIDCLVVRPDDSVVVVEFKTGQPRAAHDAQAAIYAEAASRLFPGARIESRLIYP
ncbi:MAG TPA: UvrD-helicase domain-containing protein [Vicinamibacterales bacterium]|nr:UvrD-helicase domain-containing protein [Vicinamibacterales bacterium]